MDISVKSVDETPLLFKAVKDENIEVINLLMELGVDINTKDKYGMTSLFEAVRDSKIVNRTWC